MRKVLLLGASGNIGTQSLDIFEADKASFELVGISVGKQTDKIEPILQSSSAEMWKSARPSPYQLRLRASCSLSLIARGTDRTAWPTFRTWR